jgi:hypothetical protein
MHTKQQAACMQTARDQQTNVRELPAADAADDVRRQGDVRDNDELMVDDDGPSGQHELYLVDI